jgi:hypothetical protein
MLRPRIYFKYLLGTTLLLPAFFSIFAQPALATCCKCVPKTETNVNVCIETEKTDCATLKDSKNAFVKEMSCTLVEGLCKSLNEGGVCTQGPAEEGVYTPPVQAGQAAAASGPAGTAYTAPVLGVAIPGLKLSDAEIVGGEIRVPWFAQYISAIHEYIIGISVVVAAIAIAYGGILYIVGSAAGTIQKGKTIITNSLIGLFLILGAYTILATINPATVQPLAITIKTIIPDLTQPMALKSEANDTLKRVGITPRQTVSGIVTKASNQKIPTECPGRNKSYEEPGENRYTVFGGQKKQTRFYTIQCGNRSLDQKTLDFYRKVQEDTGVPAGVIMAQMVFEKGMCSIFDLAEGRSAGSYFNFFGAGCTKKDVPADSCAHVGFGPLAYNGPPRGPKSGPISPHPLDCSVWNSNPNIGNACVKICQTQTQNSFTNCGDKCFPVKSSTCVHPDGKQVCMPSVQCSPKFNSVKEALQAHVGFDRFCLPYNDSVLKFAYCIGASTGFGTGEYALGLATVIERNCLCDPNTDSLGCVRNKELEDKLAKEIFKKINLANDVTGQYKPDFDKIVNHLLESTDGLLNTNDQVNNYDDINPRQ